MRRPPCLPVLAALAALCAPGQAFAVPITISAGAPGAVRLTPGDDVRAGYTLRLPGTHAANELSVGGASIAIAGRCPHGSPASFTIPLSSSRYAISAALPARGFDGSA